MRWEKLKKETKWRRKKRKKSEDEENMKQQRRGRGGMRMNKGVGEGGEGRAGEE